MVLGTTNAERVGRLEGTPFAPADLPEHVHKYYANGGPQSLDDYKLGPGSDVKAVTNYAPAAQNGVTPPAYHEYPLLQLALCEQDSPPTALVDELPQFTVALFNGKSCPRPDDPKLRWVPYEKANGRFIVPLPAAGTQERQVGADWRAGPGPQHAHNPDTGGGGARAEHRAESINGDGRQCSSGCYDTTGWGKADQFTTLTMTAEVKPPIQMGYVELLACMKTGEQVPVLPKTPPHFTYFRAAADCAGRYRAYASAGRFLVGVPMNGQPYAAYGKKPLTDGEIRTHDHGVVLFQFLAREGGTPPQVLAVSSTGNIPRNIIKHRNYAFNATFEKVSLGLPYVQLAHCIFEKPNPSILSRGAGVAIDSGDAPNHPHP
jgi:hypothetical protein